MFVRREVRSLTDDTLKFYAVAVKAMKERSPSDTTSWWYQAAVHGSLDPPQKLYNQCVHGSWYFPPWHRMYLYYFEKIVRDAVEKNGGPSDWALPYWNYGIDDAHASMPEPFYEPPTEANPLYVKERRQRAPGEPGINEGGILPKEIRSDALALACEIYPGNHPRQLGGGTTGPRHRWSEAGQLEELPHNLVHDAIGGGGWMSSVPKAAKDPIFWLHHSNIDRIWAQWNFEGHPNPGDASWLGQRFSFFDVDGSEVSLTVDQVLEIQPDLDYTYDVIPPGPQPEEPPAAPPTAPPTAPTAPAAGEAAEPAMAGAADDAPKVVGATEETVTLTGGPEAVPVAIDDRAQEDVQEASRKTDPRRLYLNIENIEGKTNPGTMYGVYLNLPEDPDEKTLEEHYAGAVSFFGVEHTENPPKDEHGHQLRYVLEVGALLRSLGDGEKYDQGDLKVSFRPLSLLPPEGASEEEYHAAATAPEAAAEESPVEIGRVSLSVAE